MSTKVEASQLEICPAPALQDESNFTPRWDRGPAGPPRSVPVSVRLRILLGGFSNQFGWFFFGFGMIFVWIFGGTATLRNVVFFSGELPVADARITDVVETDVTINEQKVYEYRYAYRVDGVDYEGATRANAGKYKVGAKAVVEYPAQSPGRSRIQGLSSDHAWVSLICAIFPAIGLTFMFFGIRKGLKGARLLRHGKHATGVLISTEPTNASINHQPVIKFTFEFEADDERSYEVIAKTHVSERFAGEDVSHDDASDRGIDEREAGDEETFAGDIHEPLLYDPSNPSDAIMLDDLPGGPRINENGEIQGAVSSLVPLLIVPGVSFFGHSLWLLHVLEMV